MSEAQVPKRPLPDITPMNDYFWLGGKEGALKILHCNDCRKYIHPYAARCIHCGSSRLAPKAVSGKGTVVGFTINHQPWIKDLDVPYVIALVALEEQEDIRLMSDMPKCPPDNAQVGMPVEVYFEEQDGVFVPLFEPTSGPEEA